MDLKDRWGDTPIDDARHHGFHGLANLLESHSKMENPEKSLNVQRSGAKKASRKDFFGSQPNVAKDEPNLNPKENVIVLPVITETYVVSNQSATRGSEGSIPFRERVENRQSNEDITQSRSNIAKERLSETSVNKARKRPSPKTVNRASKTNPAANEEASTAAPLNVPIVETDATTTSNIVGTTKSKPKNLRKKAAIVKEEISSPLKPDNSLDTENIKSMTNVKHSPPATIPNSKLNGKKKKVLKSEIQEPFHDAVNSERLHESPIQPEVDQETEPAGGLSESCNMPHIPVTEILDSTTAEQSLESMQSRSLSVSQVNLDSEERNRSQTIG